MKDRGVATEKKSKKMFERPKRTVRRALELSQENRLYIVTASLVAC